MAKVSKTKDLFAGRNAAPIKPWPKMSNHNCEVCGGPGPFGVSPKVYRNDIEWLEKSRWFCSADLPPKAARQA